MQYSVLHIQTSFVEDWQTDLFQQQMGDLGIDTIDGNDYYIPTELLQVHKAEIEELIAATDGVRLLSIEACEDANWNATWEAAHPVQDLPLGVRIVPHCAFGAGHHETTSMMIEALLNEELRIKNHKWTVLDHGTGTGVLAIMAKRLGAERVVAVDIDDKSVENARENAALNGEQIEVQLGNTVPLIACDLLLANIHRNVLLDNMARYAADLRHNGELWLSGFYEADCPILQAAAEAHGLTWSATHANGEWRMMQFTKSQIDNYNTHTI